jgi:hypothetical protein
MEPMSDPHTDSSPGSAACMDVPEEIQRATAGASHATGCALAAIFLLLPAVTYFGFFGLLVLDELVLQTRYLGPEKLPPGAIEWIEFIYYPLILLVRWALGLE